MKRAPYRRIDAADAEQMLRAFAAGLSTRQACLQLGLNRYGWPSCPPPEVWRSRKHLRKAVRP